MSLASRLAVEVTKGDDNLDIWVDANNNGVRDDDDVNIYVTANGGFYTTSPTFKHALDTVIQGRIKQLAVALLKKEGDLSQAEETLCELALEMVVKAQDLPLEILGDQPLTTPADAAPAEMTAWEEAPANTAAWHDQPVHASEWETHAAQTWEESPTAETAPVEAAEMAPAPQPEPIMQAAPIPAPATANMPTPLSGAAAKAVWVNLQAKNGQ